MTRSAFSPLVAAATLLFLFAAPASPARLIDFVISNVGTDSPCEPGPEVSEFLTTDAQVSAFMIIGDMAAGDRVQFEWLQPSGAVFGTSDFDAVSSAGDWCFAGLMRIAGQPMASLPGLWRVRLRFNDSPATAGGQPIEETFTLREPGGAGSGANLLTNGGAEMGPVSPGQCRQADGNIPGWTVTGNTVVCAYGADEPGFPAGAEVGAHFFAGGPDANRSSIVQNVDLSSRAAEIDAGSVTSTLSGLLGGWNGQDDNVVATVRFFGDRLISQGRIGPVLAADRQGQTRLLARSVDKTVPKGARRAEVTVEFNRVSGAFNDGYADNLSFTLSAGGGGGGACTITLVPTSASFPAAGGSRTVNVVASASSCAWSATSNRSWITIDSGGSGTGNGSVRYTVAANTGSSSRSGTLTIGGGAFSIQQQGASSSGGGVSQLGGVINAASGMPTGVPGGGLAQGSFFSLFGTNIGPASPAQATSFPLPQSLGGASVSIIQGGVEVQCILTFVFSTQINGIVPSSAPLGQAEMVLRYAGGESRIPVRIVRNNLGIFSLEGGRGPGIIQNFVSQTSTPLNSSTETARPGQVIIIWATGLGPISGPDNQPPPVGDLPFNVQVLAGGKPARILYQGRAPCCSGVDQLVVELAADTPAGCNVPVQVSVEGVFSNIVTMAVEPQNQACTPPDVPFIDMAAEGGRSGAITLLRASAFVELEGGEPPLDLVLDLGLGLFLDAESFSSHPLFGTVTDVPPMGTCQALAQNQDLGELLGGIDINDLGGATGSIPGGAPDVTGLDAGPALSITGPTGTTIPMPALDPDTPGVYLGLLGGSLPLLPGAGSMPPFLDGGAYRIAGPGGAKVGGFSVSVMAPPPLRWSNRSQVSTINRGQALRINWTGGGTNDIVIIAGGSSNEATKTVGGFVCFEDASRGTYTVPVSVVANLPSTGAQASLEGSGAILGIVAVPLRGFPTFSASGLDRGFVVNASLDIRTVAVQ